MKSAAPTSKVQLGHLFIFFLCAPAAFLFFFHNLVLCAPAAAHKNRRICAQYYPVATIIFSFVANLLYIDSISTINHHFVPPRPQKPLHSSPGYQNLPGVLSRAHSDHWGPLSDLVYLKKLGFGHYIPS